MDITSSISNFNRNLKNFEDPAGLFMGNTAKPLIDSAKIIMEFLKPSKKLNEY